MAHSDGEYAPILTAAHELGDRFRRKRDELKQDMRTKREIINLNMERKRLQFRKRITGEENKRVRDHIREKRKEPPIIRLLDKIAFTGGVLTLATCEFLVLCAPEWFFLFYATLIILLMNVKWQYYKQLKWHYFMIDFCYFANLSCLLQIFLFPNHSLIGKVNFLFANGPLAMAIVLWRNSLVFHDIDRCSSAYIHYFPILFTLCCRWYPVPNLPALLSQVYHYRDEPELDDAISFLDIFVATVLYVMWQVLYLLKTEVLDREVFLHDPQLKTSLSWLGHPDTTNGLSVAILALLKRVGVMAPDEKYDPSTTKTKATFVISQFIYTLFCFALAPIVYRDIRLHFGLVVFLLIVMVHNGASYYIDVFSRRYVKKFE